MGNYITFPKVLKLSGRFEIIPQRVFQNATGEKVDSNLYFSHLKS